MRKVTTNYLLRIWFPFTLAPIQSRPPFSSRSEAEAAYEQETKKSTRTTVQLRERTSDDRHDRVIAEREGTPPWQK
jgi:hypothetical protein